MSTFRRQRSKDKWEKGSFCLPNKLIQDINLSDSALRLLAWMESCAPEWVIIQEDIMRRFKWGEKKMRAAIDNLIEYKYLINLGQTRSSGDFGPCEYEFSAQGFTDQEIKEIKEKFAYPPRAGTPEACTVEAGTKQIPSILTNPNPNIVCIADANGSDKKEEKKTAAPEMQTVRRIEKKNGRGDPISLNWDDLITYATNYKKDWRVTEMREAWQILHDRNGFVNDMIEFLAGTISNLRDKTRAIYANKGKPPCTSQQTIKPKSEMKNSPDTSRSNSENSSEKDIRVNVLDALISLRQQLGQSLDGLPPRRTS